MTDRYALPDLPYAYDALEPWCSAETLTLHHDKHHRAYITAANEAVETLAAIDPVDSHCFNGVQAALSFNVGGHVLHSLFWESMSPEITRPSDDLRAQIKADFGSLDRLRDLLAAECKGVQGSGWGALIYHPADSRLQVGRLHDHQHGMMPNASLLAVIDVWEHAYYLGYRNLRMDWVAAVIEHLDWTKISARFAAASVRAVAGALPASVG